MEPDQLLCLQLGDASETVIVYDTSDGSTVENTGFSYGGYLENIRDKLLQRKLVYEDGLGIVATA